MKIPNIAKDVMKNKSDIVSIKIEDTIEDAIKKMDEKDVRKIVIETKGKFSHILKNRKIRNEDLNKKVIEIKDRLDPVMYVNEDTSIDHVADLLEHCPAVVVKSKEGSDMGIITAMDIINNIEV